MGGKAGYYGGPPQDQPLMPEGDAPADEMSIMPMPSPPLDERATTPIEDQEAGLAVQPPPADGSAPPPPQQQPFNGQNWMQQLLMQFYGGRQQSPYSGAIRNQAPLMPQTPAEPAEPLDMNKEAIQERRNPTMPEGPQGPLNMNRWAIMQRNAEAKKLAESDEAMQIQI